MMFEQQLRVNTKVELLEDLPTKKAGEIGIICDIDESFFGDIFTITIRWSNHETQEFDIQNSCILKKLKFLGYL